MNGIDLGILSHKLKSPLVSIKSIAFILRSSNKKNTKALSYLKEIDNKVDILAKRIDKLISYLEYQKGDVDFLYQVFDIAEILNQIKGKIKVNKINQTIIGDKEKIAFALLTFLQLFSKIKNLKILKKNKFLQISIKGDLGDEKIKKQINLKDTVDLEIEYYLAKRIIELHGGKIREEKNKLLITIPFKACPQPAF
ncbi:MAG: hypothetical protein A2152_03915 [Candidatus Levybacteria bacterium RBG_16_35_6]|nr:MAG: hypothetical protein A2152_03915 [Candidatus Levybacteria bacterium RBG_16_35_6]